MAVTKKTQLLRTEQAEVRPMVSIQFCHELTFLLFQRDRFPFHRTAVMAQQQRIIFLARSGREYNSALFCFLYIPLQTPRLLFGVVI